MKIATLVVLLVLALTLIGCAVKEPAVGTAVDDSTEGSVNELEDELDSLDSLEDELDLSELDNLDAELDI